MESFQKMSIEREHFFIKFVNFKNSIKIEKFEKFLTKSKIPKNFYQSRTI